MSAARGFQRSLAVRGDDLGQRAGIGRRNARAGRGETTGRGGSANGEIIVSSFGWKSEIARVCSACLKRNDIARLRLIDRRLKIAARGHGDGPSSRRRIGGVDEDAQEFQLNPNNS